MTVIRTLLAAFLCIGVATPPAARERAPASSPRSQKRGASFVAAPIEPMKPHEEKPKAGWNGLYGGFNAGAGVGEAGTR